MCLAETLPFDKYEDDSVDGTLDKPLEELEPKPDLSKYVELNAPIVFPWGDRITWGKFVRRKRYIDGNPIGRENQNPSIDTLKYEVGFTNGEVKNITANVIDERLYAQFDKDVNYMFLLNSCVDYRKTEQAI